MTQVSVLLTAQEVAEILGTSAETVRRWARVGSLPAITLPSGRVRFRREDIDAQLQPNASTG